MNIKLSQKLCLFVALLCGAFLTVSYAKNSYAQVASSTLLHMNNMATYCVGSWEDEACIKELSSISMDLTTGYAELLDASKQQGAMEVLKQHCAASTAALKVLVPAYAMKSAITECVNSISDISEATLIKPDLNLYQFMVISVMCLGNDPSCKDIEQQFKSRPSR